MVATHSLLGPGALGLFGCKVSICLPPQLIDALFLCAALSLRDLLLLLQCLYRQRKHHKRSCDSMRNRSGRLLVHTWTLLASSSRSSCSACICTCTSSSGGAIATLP